MPLTVTLADLRAAVRERSDTVNSPRLTNTKLDRLINSSIKRLHMKVCALGEEEFTQPCTIFTTAGQEWSLLPNDLLILRGIEWYPSGSFASATVSMGNLNTLTASTTRLVVVESIDGLPDCFPIDATIALDPIDPELPVSETVTIIDVTYSEGAGWILVLEEPVTLTWADGTAAVTWTGTTFTPSCDPVPMDRFQLQNRHRWMNSGGGWSSGIYDGWRRVAYRLLNKNKDAIAALVDSGGSTTSSQQRVYWAPVPQAQHAVRVWYIREPQVLTDATDAYDGRSGFEEWVVIDAAIAVMTGEESDISALSVERDRVWLDQIQPLFQARDAARPERVIDVDERATRWLTSDPGEP